MYELPNMVLPIGSFFVPQKQSSIPEISTRETQTFTASFNIHTQPKSNIEKIGLNDLVHSYALQVVLESRSSLFHPYSVYYSVASTTCLLSLARPIRITDFD